MKILLTGSEGFIGSHLCEALVKQGHAVKAFVLYNSFNSSGWLESFNSETKGHFEICLGDIRDASFVRKSVKNCDAVMHLASLIGIPYSYHSPESYVQTNISGALNLLLAARDFNVQKFIHTSTSEVYGTAQKVPITEDHPIVGQSPYSATKIAADQLAYSFYTSFGLPVATLRPFNTYGPRQSSRAVIPTIITQILNKKKKIKLGSLMPRRDFTYVDDITAAFIATLKKPKAIGETINLGSNFDINIKDTANLIAKLIGIEVEFAYDKIRARPEKSEVLRLLACNKKALNILGWKPRYGKLKGFEKGLKKTIEWFSEENNLKKYNFKKFII